MTETERAAVREVLQLRIQLANILAQRDVLAAELRRRDVLQWQAELAALDENPADQQERSDG